ncbi:MAG: 1,2-phenylacetyl-CoA epoxidase subunit A, partial [Candidatus Phosphoribacter sp.]
MYGNDFDIDDPGAGPLNAADGGAVEAAAAHEDRRAELGTTSFDAIIAADQRVEPHDDMPE